MHCWSTVKIVTHPMRIIVLLCTNIHAFAQMRLLHAFQTCSILQTRCSPLDRLKATEGFSLHSSQQGGQGWWH